MMVDVDQCLRFSIEVKLHLLSTYRRCSCAEQHTAGAQKASHDHRYDPKSQSSTFHAVFSGI